MKLPDRDVIPINTGNLRRKAARRGMGTFVRLSEWARSGRAIIEAQAMGIRLRIWSHQPVELTVLDAVPDIMSFVVDVVTLRTGQSFEPSAGMLRAVIGTTKDDLA